MLDNIRVSKANSVQAIPHVLRQVKVDPDEHLLHFGAVIGEFASLRLLQLLQLLLPFLLQADEDNVRRVLTALSGLSLSLSLSHFSPSASSA